MATRNNGHNSATDYPYAVIFQERDGIYWLRGNSLALAKRLLDLPCYGEAVGFDWCTALLHAQILLARKVKVATSKAGMVRALALRRQEKLTAPESKPILLPPQALVGRKEVQRLDECARRSSTNAPEGGIDRPSVYVYEVAQDWYEVDWELTTLPARSFEALVVTAYRTGEEVSCQLVLPKPRRGKVAAPHASLLIKEPQVYGQLRLAI